MESAASGLTAAIGLSQVLSGKPEPDFGTLTLLGALSRHVSTPSSDFQPMNANFGLLPPLEKKNRNKKERYEQVSARSLEALRSIIETQLD